MSTKATLSKFNKLFDIVDGSELDPTPRTNDGSIRHPIPAALQARIDKWHHDHDRAREAIIRCLPDAELLKLEDIQEDIAAIWKRLRDQYGRPSNLEYIRASNELILLKKDEKTSINDHINKFEQLVYEVNYNKPSNTRNMEELEVKLKFLNTLIVDEASAEKWENAMGPQLETMSKQQLYAEVRVNAGRTKSTETLPNEVAALQTDSRQSIQALNTRMDSFQRGNRGNGDRGQGEGGQGGKSGSPGGFNGGNRRGRGRGRWNNNRKTRYPYDTNKSREIHGRGHST
jgi:gag-polypeptide of LTR copia-type